MELQQSIEDKINEAFDKIAAVKDKIDILINQVSTTINNAFKKIEGIKDQILKQIEGFLLKLEKAL